MRRHPVVLLLAVPAVLITVLTGCSGSSAAPTPSAAPSPSASPSPSPSPLPSPSPTASPSPSPSPSTVAASPRLTGDGIDLPGGVVLFGTTFDKAAPALRRALGAPTRDSGVTSSFSTYGTCPGTKLRALEYGGGALVVLFGNVKGSALTMYQWALQPKGNAKGLPRASAFVGDVTTYDFGIGTTLAQLRKNIPADMLKVSSAAGSQAPSFTVSDQSSGFTGQLSGTTGQDDVTYVLAGRPCGE